LESTARRINNVPGWLQTQAGPFDQWPTGMGFEFFYGFVGGDTKKVTPRHRVAACAQRAAVYRREKQKRPTLR
jgi:hypothetical protein